MRRREVLKAGGSMGLLGALAAAGFLPAPALAQQAWNAAAFSIRSVPGTLKALGAVAPAENKAIQIVAADIAENGMVVPITVSSSIARTESIAILIEKNPNTLSSVFSIPAGTEAFISTRVKLAESTALYALARAEGRYYFAKKDIKVTLGGCGG